MANAKFMRIKPVETIRQQVMQKRDYISMPPGYHVWLAMIIKTIVSAIRDQMYVTIHGLSADLRQAKIKMKAEITQMQQAPARINCSIVYPSTHSHDMFSFE